MVPALRFWTWKNLHFTNLAKNCAFVTFVDRNCVSVGPPCLKNLDFSIFAFSCSLNSTTDSETTTPEFSKIF